MSSIPRRAAGQICGVDGTETGLDGTGELRTCSVEVDFATGRVVAAADRLAGVATEPRGLVDPPATIAPPTGPQAVRNLFDSVVLQNTPLCREHYRLTLRLAEFPATMPGQFVQIACAADAADAEPREFAWPAFGLGVSAAGAPGPEAGDAGATPLVLRRPFSIAGRRDTPDGVELDVIARTVGVGTRYLERLKTGDPVSLLGPLGNAFVPPPPGGIALLVGGGVGIPPMLYLAEALGREMADASVERPRRTVAFCGAMTRDLVPLTITADAPTPSADSVAPLYNVAEFARHGAAAVLSTDDGSYGFKGFVTDTLRQYLDAWITDNADRARTVIYACGPEGMLKAVAEVARRRSIACQVCVERAMACGLGTCQSCVIKTKKPDPSVPPLAGSDWCYRLACTDGPVFEAETLLW